MQEELRADSPRMIKEARLRLGLEEVPMAEQVGLPVAWYRDIENHHGEVTSNLSLEHLLRICRIAGIDVRDLFVPMPTRHASVSPSEFVGVLRGWVDSSHLSLMEAEKRCGWELGKVLADPQSIWQWNLDELRDVAAMTGADWVGLLLAGGGDVSTRPTR